MDLIDQLVAIAARAQKTIAHIQTEEATKNALVMPFINALGYNVFDPTEVVPEFVCDVGTKKGEKVDYAIFQDGKPIMLFECKHVGGDLSLTHAGQLLRYFHVTEARIGVLTNGTVYRFYTDLEKPNRMDERPFLEIDLMNIQEAAVAELKKLTKGAFNLDDMLSAAHDLKYTRALKGYLSEQFSQPADDLVRFLTKQVYEGAVTAKVAEQFSEIVRRALHQMVNDRVSGRLKSAMLEEQSIETPAAEAEEAPAPTQNGKPDINTTEEEREGFHIVRALLRDTVDVRRIAHRDVQSYFGILLDDNNRKPICRLHLNGSKKYLTVFDVEGGERVDIESIDDIYSLADRLRTAAQRYAT